MKISLSIFGIVLFYLASSFSMSLASDCGKLSEEKCIESSKCTLIQNKNKEYSCIKATSKYEKGFVQWGETSQFSCTSKKECSFVPSSYYCAPNIIYRCSGGKPVMCVSEGEISYNKSLNLPHNPPLHVVSWSN